MNGVYCGMRNGYGTISVSTSFGEPDYKWSPYLVCILGIFGLVKIQIVPLICYFYS